MKNYSSKVVRWCAQIFGFNEPTALQIPTQPHSHIFKRRLLFNIDLQDSYNRSPLISLNQAVPSSINNQPTML